MLKNNFLHMYFLLNILLFSCEKNSTSPQTAFKVTGYVYYLGEPIEGVTISIDDKVNWNVRTGADGSFEITGVSTGDHQLKMRKDVANLQKNRAQSLGFTERTVNISVYDDVELSNLKLPKAVLLYEAKNITEASAEITWSTTDDEIFSEYKLYKHSTSGLDETTGTLVHVSTLLTDTSFVDNQLIPFQNYFYRVYVMNEYGRIGGSNIIQFQTSNVQLIQNGGFEEVSGEKPTGWLLTDNTFGNPENAIVIDDSDPFAGSNSLKFHHAGERGCWEMWVSQVLDKSLLVEGATYRLTLNYKSDFLEDNGFNLILRNPAVDLWLYYPFDIIEQGEWTEVSYEFGLPTDIGNNDIKMDIHFCNQGIKNWWIDDIKLEKTE